MRTERRCAQDRVMGGGLGSICVNMPHRKGLGDLPPRGTPSLVAQDFSSWGMIYPSTPLRTSSLSAQSVRVRLRNGRCMGPATRM
jgi:hypothetical protein